MSVFPHSNDDRPPDPSAAAHPAETGPAVATGQAPAAGRRLDIRWGQVGWAAVALLILVGWGMGRAGIERIKLARLAAEHLTRAADLAGMRQLDEAVAAVREAIRIQPDHAPAYYNLGSILMSQGKLDDAQAAYTEALRLKPDYPEAQCNLGMVLGAKGQYADSLAAFRRGHELGANDPRWAYPSAQWVQDAERLVELDKRLNAALRGGPSGAIAADRVELARFCADRKQFFGLAARFFAEGFAAQPALADDLENRFRYRAACAAALAGRGQGRDVGNFNEPQRARLRQQALAWLRADLTGWAKQTATKNPQTQAAARDALQQWQLDPRLAGVREADALSWLPKNEQEAWATFWTDVKSLQARSP